MNVSQNRNVFQSKLGELVEGVPTGERVVDRVDLDGHVAEGNRRDGEVPGRYSVKDRHVEQMIVGFAKRTERAAVNTYFRKREARKITYKSGGQSDADREITSCAGSAI